MVGLLGPNGAGKTTTLRVLAGLLRPSAGATRICGVDMQTHPVEAQRQLGFLTGSTGLYDRLTGPEMLQTFGAVSASMSPPWRRASPSSVRSSSWSRSSTSAAALSSGQKQRSA